MYELINCPPKSSGAIVSAINGSVVRDYGGYYYPQDDVTSRIQERTWRDLGYIEWADAMVIAMAEAKKQRGETNETL